MVDTASPDPAGTPSSPGPAPAPRSAATSGPPQRRRRRTAVALAVVLAAVGAFGLVGPSRSSRLKVARVGANVPVNADAVDRLSVNARNTPAIVANPRNASQLALANRVDAPRLGCGLQFSADGGGSWQPVALPALPDKVVTCFGPDVAFDADGTLVAAFTSFAALPNLGTVPDAVWVTVSHDQGQTFSAPVQAGGALAFQVRLAADPGRPGRLFLTWLQTTESSSNGFPNFGNPIVVSRSDNTGATWSAPARVTPAGRSGAVGPSPLVGAGGTLFVAYLDVGQDKLDYTGAHQGKGGPPDAGPWSLVVARSPDGAAWEESTVDAALVPARRFRQLFAPAPALAADASGRRLYVAFDDASLGDADVWTWASPDGGRTWTTRRRVNDTPRRDGSSQYLAAAAVAPDGRLDVVYYDRRADHDDVMNEVSLQSSTDGGRTFTPSVRLSDRPFDSRIGFGGDSGLAELGSRLGLLSRGAGSLAVWSDTRGGTSTLIKQDLASEIARARRVASAPAAVRVGSLVVLAAGCLLALAALLTARSGGKGPRRPG